MNSCRLCHPNRSNLILIPGTTLFLYCFSLFLVLSLVEFFCIIVFLFLCFFFDWTYLDNNIFIFTNMLFSFSHFNTNRIRLKFFLLALQFLG